nr:DUF5672 family protein [uncultured Haemophilus sp.]
MNNKKSVTIVSITGNQDYTEGAKHAIVQSYLELQSRINDLRCLLISPEKPKNLPDYIQYIPCSPFSYIEYNIFLLYSLSELIETDFALIVQSDGWVMNGKNWDDKFFEYDYIGAPIPILIDVNDNEKLYLINFWLNHYNNIPNNMYEPQNGGFSLRSKKLLEAPRKLALNWNISAPNLFETEPLKLKWKNNIHNEDIFLSAIKRKVLEENGIKFAPREIAARFSVETIVVQQELGLMPSEILGCHCSSNATLIDHQTVQLNFDVHSENDLYNNFLIQALLHSGHQFVVKPSN